MLDDILTKPGPHISFEFYPPKDDDGLNRIYKAIRNLSRFVPDFVSITWGAGGSTIRKSLEIADHVTNQIGVLCIAHFTGLGMKKKDVDELLRELKKRRVNNILVLRGDIPHNMDREEAFHDGFEYASELVKYIRSKPKNDKKYLGILVAGCPEGHPEAPTLESDMNHTASKVREGAQGIVTQLFWKNDFFYRFTDEMKSRDIHVPISAGIMIMTKAKMIKKIIELSNCFVPEELNQAIKKYENDDASMEAYGIEYATRQVQDLLNHGFRRFHFYTMNRAKPVEAIILNLADSLCECRGVNVS